MIFLGHTHTLLSDQGQPRSYIELAIWLVRTCWYSGCFVMLTLHILVTLYVRLTASWSIAASRASTNESISLGSSKQAGDHEKSPLQYSNVPHERAVCYCLSK